MATEPLRRRLQLCASNRLARRPDIRHRLEAAGCTIEVEDCLDQCTRCETCAFALVGGRFVFAATPEAFVQKVGLKDSHHTSRKP